MTELDEISEQIEGLATHFDTKFESMRKDINTQIGGIREEIREVRTEVRDDRKANRDDMKTLRECDSNQKQQTGKIYSKLSKVELEQQKAEQRDTSMVKELDEHKGNKEEHFDKEKASETGAAYLAKKKMLLILVAFLSIVVPSLAAAIVKWLQTFGG